MSMERMTEVGWNGVIRVDYTKHKESVMQRLAKIEDILGDDYDLGRLRELAQADREGRRAALPYKKWVHLGGDEWCCSSCGNVIYTEGSWEKPEKKYCEECGAKMDVEQEE